MALWLVNTLIVTVLAAVDGDAVQRDGRLRLRLLPVPRAATSLFGLVLATMMLPGAVTMIPVYLIWNGSA